MPRERRIEDAGAICHTMARGNRRGEIVLDDHDRRRFVETLEEAGEASGRVLPAWVLMSDHFHFLLRWRGTSLASRTGDPCRGVIGASVLEIQKSSQMSQFFRQQGLPCLMQGARFRMQSRVPCILNPES